MNYILLIAFGLAPSIIWLSYYLQKDVHPEPKRMVLKIFFCGAIITIPALFLEMCFSKGFDVLSLLFSVSPSPSEISQFLRQGLLQISNLSSSALLMFFLYSIIGIAFVEETFKYLVVKYKVLNDPEFDEPVDAMIYMIIAGLGFAALENILYLSPHLFPVIKFSETFQITAIRFLGAVFLHALCSATIGYFLALSIFEAKNRFNLLFAGLIIATLLHGLFNYSIIVLEGSLQVLIPAVILISLALFVSLAFKKLKKMKSVCKIN
ncbi:PrsW family intramembrane metalloprotease [Candidatus Parcubacteria bacterium]|nr:PrsW family intramembrane metalloprotease [Candidatus Parcubacteria bacterium]